MIPGAGNNRPNDDEPNHEPPEEVTELIGTDSGIENQWIELFLERHTFDPSNLTGEIDGNPRYRAAYPSSPQEQRDLLVERGNPLLTEEFQMHVQAVSGTKIDTLPPKPLTVETLSELLERIINQDGETSYEAWVPLESEIVERTAVGEYRQAVAGNIIRFRILKDGLASTFSLLPFDHRLGFAWYYIGTVPIEQAEEVMEVEESQRLSSLVKADGKGNNDSPLASTPQRVINASRLLGGHIHTENKTATPENWLTTYCERDENASELFQPRYQATFIHKPSEIVMEVNPVSDATVPVEDADKSVSVDITDDTLHEPTHTWELEFASDEFVAEMTDEFPSRVIGDELPTIMKTIDNRLK